MSFTVPLASLSELESLGRKPEIDEILAAARRYPAANVYLTAYADPKDAKAPDTDVKSVSDRLVIEMGKYLVGRGIAPDRISGKGMGANPNVGRAVVVAVDVAGRSSRVEPSARQSAERDAAREVPDRFPSQNTAFREVAGSAAYRVGIGDQLEVTIWFTAGPKDYGVFVGADGTVTFDLVQEAPVNGLTVIEIQDLFKNILRKYIRSPRVTVVVSGFASRNVTVIGPSGAKNVVLSGRTTVLDLLSRNDVTPPEADLKSVRVVRGGQEFDVNVYRVVIDRDWRANLVLDDGDIIYMPTFQESGSYAIVLGEVEEPGIYQMRTPMTAVEAVFAAGGATDDAFLPHARIVRGDLSKPRIMPANLDLVLQKGDLTATETLENGDIVYVPATRIANWNAFIKDLQPTASLLSQPFQGFGGALLFGRGDRSTSTSTTIIVIPTPALIP